MPLAPEIYAFGDGTHQIGETGLSIEGAGFYDFGCTAWMYANADRSGAADELTVGSQDDMSLSGVEIPGTTTNVPGSVYLFVQREDLAWSDGYSFTLASAAGQGITPATEADAAQALTGEKRASIPIAAETDSAIALTGSKTGSQPVALETDSAVALTGYKAASTPVAEETDSAIALSSSVGQSITPATETDAAVALTGAKRGSITPATETDKSIRLRTTGEVYNLPQKGFLRNVGGLMG